MREKEREEKMVLRKAIRNMGRRREYKNIHEKGNKKRKKKIKIKKVRGETEEEIKKKNRKRHLKQYGMNRKKV